MRRPLLRARAALARMRGILLFLAAWFTIATLAYRFGAGLPWTDALLSALYFEVQDGVYSQGYAFWGQSLIFGVLVGLLLREGLENYAERCRLMSKFVKDHTIIVGYTHLGQRLVDHCLEKGLPYVLIEKNRELVDDLLRRGEPVIVDDAKSRDCLPSANIKEARRIIIASNNVETALVVTKTARDANPKVQIVTRCHLDDLVGVFEKLGANVVYSASLAAFHDIAKVFND